MLDIMENTFISCKSKFLPFQISQFLINGSGLEAYSVILTTMKSFKVEEKSYDSCDVLRMKGLY